jgi:hypothetical protein
MSTPQPQRHRLHTLDEIYEAGRADQAAQPPMTRQQAERLAPMVAAALAQLEASGEEGKTTAA